MSSSTHLFGVPLHAPGHPESIFPGLTGSRLAPPPPPPRNSEGSHSRPRLPSPRLFRDFFSSDMHGGSQRSQADAPRLPLFREASNLDPAQLAGAITRTSQAVDGLQQAFQPRRSGRGRDIVDLTDSPPEAETVSDATGSHSRGGADADYLSTTTHPLDFSRSSIRRRVNPLNEPVFGYQPFPPAVPYPIPEEDRSDSAARVRARRAQAFQNRHVHIHRSRNTEQEERDAVRRQRENHAAWQRTQARTRQFQTRNEQENLRHSTPASSNSFLSESSPGPSRPGTCYSDMSKDTNAGSQASPAPATPIEAVDLTAVENDSAVEATLSKQRTDMVLSQRPKEATENGRTKLTAKTCAICLDRMTNPTATICGHVFCHECILNTLRWSEQQRREEHGPGGRKKHGLCPSCRKVLAIKDSSGQGRTLVPIEFEVMIKKRKVEVDTKGKGKAKEIDDGKETRSSKRLKREKREGTDERLMSSFLNYEA